MGKVENCPVAIIRNFKFDFSDAKIQKIIRPKAEDLFR
jgi:F420-0:gamma-glutamyl ligase